MGIGSIGTKRTKHTQGWTKPKHKTCFVLLLLWAGRDHGYRINKSFGDRALVRAHQATNKSCCLFRCCSSRFASSVICMGPCQFCLCFDPPKTNLRTQKQTNTGVKRKENSKLERSQAYHRTCALEGSRQKGESYLLFDPPPTAPLRPLVLRLLHCMASASRSRCRFAAVSASAALLVALGSGRTGLTNASRTSLLTSSIAASLPSTETRRTSCLCSDSSLSRSLSLSRLALMEERLA